MNKSIPERIFVWEDEINEFLLGKRKQVQIGINQDPVRGLLTYIRKSTVVQPEVDLEKEAESYIIGLIGELKGYTDWTPRLKRFAKHFFELGLNARGK